MSKSYWVETLGCPKNQVDSDKLTGALAAGGMAAAASPEEASLVVVNTCAFVEDARQESIDTILALVDERRDEAEVVVTGCLAERYGTELADSLPEVDTVAGFGVAFDGLAGLEAGADGGSGAVPVTIGSKAAGPLGGGSAPPVFDLLNLPRPHSAAPWAYVKIAEGCDRRCGFCAIPSFRGPQRSRGADDILREVDETGAREIVLVAQDLASFGRDQGEGDRELTPLLGAISTRVDRVRCLYLYPSDLTDELVEAILGTGVPYFDLSLQHVSPALLRRMRRRGDGERFLDRIESIRVGEPDAAFRSNFIVGYPGETEDDHDALVRFIEQAQVDWCGFFAYSREEGTLAAELGGTVPETLVAERLSELGELQDAITARKRDDLIGRRVEVLVDEPGLGRTHREAPEIDGVVVVPEDLPVGEFASVTVGGTLGPDLDAS